MSRKFSVILGNPPYNGGLYCQFLEKLDSLCTKNTRFDILIPSYSFTRSKSEDACRRAISLTSVDYQSGEYFRQSISGVWVARFRGEYGITQKPIHLQLTDGTTIIRSLDQINPTSEKFIKPNGIQQDDFSILDKVLIGGNQLHSHKTQPIHSKEFVYIRPTLKYVAQPSPAAGSFSLHGLANQWEETALNGHYMETTEGERILWCYTESKLFNYLNWLVISDFPMVNRSYIKSLPIVKGSTNEELYQEFSLTEQEIQRIESLL